MHYNRRNNSVVCVHNFSGEPREIRFLIQGDEKPCELANLLSDNHSRPSPGGRHSMLLEPYGYRWFRVCGLDYLLKRSDI
jgi:maltose alpha-D-glucosyltransferase/alpha-amylase